MIRLVLVILILGLMIAGEIQCFYKMVKCNWEPVGKAEIIYTVGFFSGTGALIGWLNIDDN